MSFDISTGEVKGKLVIKLIPPSQQFAVHQYVVTIDSDDYFEVSKHSDFEILLDPGEHSIKVFAIPSTWKGVYGEIFGKPSNTRINIKENDYIIFEYSGPFWMWSNGKLERKL